MSKAEILDELRQMPEAERREFIEAIEMEFGEVDEELTPEQKAELRKSKFSRYGMALEIRRNWTDD